MQIQRMSHSKWRRLLDDFEASGYQAPMTDELFEALSHCSGDSPRLAPYLREVERRKAAVIGEREAEGYGWVPDPVEVQLVHDPRMSRSRYDE
jgi:hypothetical protein